jgi:magnesium transporter
VHPLLGPLEGLERGTYLPVGHELAQFFRDVNDHLKLVNEEVIALRDLLAIILQANMAVISVAQNEMGVRQTEATKQLTLVATIFLPLSFVASFFGMNFGWLTDHITPLWAFLLYGVGSFAASLAALLFWFRRSGHLGRETRPSRDGAVTSLGG